MLGIGFNPRTHTGCDAEISGRIEALSEFQSTHPHGVRHYELKVTDGDAVFQSTHPHGVRLGEVWFCWLGRHGGFNPRTHTGCDYTFVYKMFVFYCFNPRTHTGCDSVQSYIL